MRWASLSNTMPEVWNITSTSNVSRLAVLSTVESSLNTTSKLLAVASWLNIVTPAAIESWR